MRRAFWGVFIASAIILTVQAQQNVIVPNIEGIWGTQIGAGLDVPDADFINVTLELKQTGRAVSGTERLEVEGHPDRFIFRDVAGEFSRDYRVQDAITPRGTPVSNVVLFLSSGDDIQVGKSPKGQVYSTGPEPDYFAIHYPRFSPALTLTTNDELEGTLNFGSIVSGRITFKRLVGCKPVETEVAGDSWDLLCLIQNILLPPLPSPAAPVNTTPAGPATASPAGSPEPPDDEKKTALVIALGLSGPDGSTLNTFAARYGARTLMGSTNFQKEFMEAMSNPNTKVFFNLDTVNVQAGISRAAGGVRYYVTDWELLQIKNNTAWWPRITFIKDGVQVPNPFL